VSEDGKKGWLADIADTYGVVRLWIIGILAPGLVVSEVLQGRVWLGLGLAFVCVMIWTQLARQLGAEGAALERIGNISLAIGGALLAWHYALWWVEYLR
jgi:hypothetical protein